MDNQSFSDPKVKGRIPQGVKQLLRSHASPLDFCDCAFKRSLLIGFFAGLVLLSFVGLSGVRAAAASRLTNSCELYEQLDRECDCPAGRNYLRDYGYKYCERFRRATDWTPAGAVWRDETLQCLQSELKRLAPDYVSSCNCEKLQQEAFSTHAFCYTQHRASFCSLSPRDVNKIYQIIDSADVWSGPGFRQGIAIYWNCLTGQFPRGE